MIIELLTIFTLFITGYLYVITFSSKSNRFLLPTSLLVGLVVYVFWVFIELLFESSVSIYIPPVFALAMALLSGLVTHRFARRKLILKAGVLILTFGLLSLLV